MEAWDWPIRDTSQSDRQNNPMGKTKKLKDWSQLGIGNDVTQHEKENKRCCDILKLMPKGWYPSSVKYRWLWKSNSKDTHPKWNVCTQSHWIRKAKKRWLAPPRKSAHCTSTLFSQFWRKVSWWWIAWYLRLSRIQTPDN